MSSLYRCGVLFLGVTALGGCSDAPSEPAFGETLEVIETLPHDSDAYTQGFLVRDGLFYESTGQYGASSVRKVEPETGEILAEHRLSDAYFGEGLVALGDRLFQLTWREQTGFVYDAASLEPLGTFGYRGEGWGLTTDGSHLIVSDGTYRLKFIDPTTSAVTRVVEVQDQGRFIYALNELEWIRGEIWANVWQQDNIARIDPGTGNVLGWVNVAGYLSWWDRLRGAEVANGVAYDSIANRLWVTGKNWPRVYEVEVPPEVGARVTDQEDSD